MWCNMKSHVVQKTCIICDKNLRNCDIFCIFTAEFMIEGNPYKVKVKKWRKRNRLIAVTDSPIEIIDKTTGEVRTATPFVGNRKFKDTTDFVKWYNPNALLRMKPCEVKVFAYVVGVMDFGGVVRFDYDKCMETTSMSRSMVFRGVKGLVESDVLRLRRRGEYWINPNIVYRGQRDEFEIEKENEDL